jgi:hypothetical protein
MPLSANAVALEGFNLTFNGLLKETGVLLLARHFKSYTSVRLIECANCLKQTIREKQAVNKLTAVWLACP